MLTFNEARDLISDGDIFFVKNRKNLIAWLIRLFTKSEYSHSGILFWVEIGENRRLMCVEAQGGTKRRILNFSFYDDVDLDIRTAPKSWDSVKTTALKKIGIKRYSLLDAIYVGFREFLLQYFNIKLPFANFPGEICSEFVASVYELEKRHISPQLLDQQLEKIGCERKLEIRRM